MTKWKDIKKASKNGKYILARYNNLTPHMTYWCKMLEGWQYVHYPQTDGSKPQPNLFIEIPNYTINKKRNVELESVPCKRCGEKPEIRTHCTLHEVRCINQKCPKPTTVGSRTRLECAVDSWNRKQCPHENKLPNQDLGHTICQDCGQIL